MADEDMGWFRPKRFGFGWTPARWQGWAVLAVFLAVVIGGSALLKHNAIAGVSIMVTAMVLVIIVVAKTSR